MRWDDGSFRAGDYLRLDPHVRFQTDMLLRDESEAIDDRIDWPRRRISPPRRSRFASSRSHQAARRDPINARRA